MTRAAFLDRDGVINRKAPDGAYIRSWEEFEFLPGVPEAIRALRAAGARVMVITNQRGIARGLMSQAAVDGIHGRMNAVLREFGAAVDAVFVCPHEINTCACRKPQIGLFRQALERFPDTSVADSITVGDSISDLEAGNRVGGRTFLVAPPERAERILAEARARGIQVDGTYPSLAAVVSAHRLVGAGSREA
jgi:D-glycero-D-manno-heptose 1,7-bisphosphate phosphatase